MFLYWSGSQPLICLVDKQLSVSVEEEQWVFVVLLHNPASAVLTIDFHLAVFLVHLLFSQKLVVLVEYLEVGMAVRIFYEGVHILSTYCVGNHFYIILFVYILFHYHEVSWMIVVPVAVAVIPESIVVEVAEWQWIPIYRVAVDHAVVNRVPEVWSWMDRH